MEEEVYGRLQAVEDDHWWFRGRRAVIWALLERARLGASPRILDAGCGTGRNLREYGALGDAVGVDPSPRAVAFCRERGLLRVKQAGLEELPFEDGSFDLLLAFDVLEHVEDDHAALAELHRVAVPGARLVVTSPAYRWLWSSHDTSHHHYRRYTRRELVERATRAGWTVEVATYFNTVLLLPIALVRLAERLGITRARSDYDLTPGLLNRFLELPMRTEAKLVARGLRLPAGVSVGLLLSRP